jgi:hypothetical protein
VISASYLSTPITFFSSGNSIFVVAGGTGVSTQGLMVSTQVLYHLNHAPSPFCFNYFSDRVSCFLLMPCWTTILRRMCRWLYRYRPPCSTCLLRWSLAKLSLRLASNYDLPDFCLQNSWDYKVANTPAQKLSDMDVCVSHRTGDFCETCELLTLSS